MEIKNGLYTLECTPAMEPGEVIIGVADPKMGMFIGVGGEDLEELIAYLQQELNKDKGDV